MSSPSNTEVSTPDKLEYQFHPVAANVCNFQVRAANDAHLALTTTAEEMDPMYEVFIGGWGNSKSVIRKDRKKPDVAEVDTPGILSDSEFRGFWICWCDNTITVGHKDNVAAFLTYEAHEQVTVKYIGICTGWGASGTWLIETSSAPAPIMGFAIPSTRCWVPAVNGIVPESSSEGGMDGGEQLYIARARHEGDVIPGKLQPSHGVCYVAYGGGEHACTEYEVLCSSGGKWVPVTDGNIPASAIPGGETADGQPLFIGRVNHDGNITLGKVQQSHNCCYISYNGEELAYQDFEVYADE